MFFCRDIASWCRCNRVCFLYTIAIPQTFVPNIFNAKPGDYQKATQRIWHAPGDASFISLPVVP